MGAGRPTLLALLALAWSGLAPYQCPGDPDPRARIEEPAPEAVWRLSERFRRRGDADARRETLRFIVERFPSSRYALRARRELGLPEPR